MSASLQDYDFFKKLSQLSFIQQIYLFGSRSRDEAKERSDIDLAIVCPAATDTDWMEIQKIIAEADTLLKIDCIRYDKLSDTNPLKLEIDRDKKSIYKSRNIKLSLTLENLKKAVIRLEEMVAQPVDSYRAQIDATIQRFEFTFELFWKTLKIFLETEGQITRFPRETIQAAYAGQVIDNENLWLQMMESRNRTSHIYDEKEADEIYGQIKKYTPEIVKALDQFKKKVNSVTHQ